MFNTIKVNNSDTNYTHSIFDINDFSNHPTAYSNKSDVYNSVPSSKRKVGLVITYLFIKEGINYRIIEQFIGNNISVWADSQFWFTISSVDISTISDEKIVVQTNSGEEVVLVDDNGLHAKNLFIYKSGQYIPIPIVDISQNTENGIVTVSVENGNSYEVAPGSIGNVIKVNAAEALLEDKIAITTDEDEEVVNVVERGIIAKAFFQKYGDNEYIIIPESQIGERLIDSTSLLIYDNNVGFIAEIKDDGIYAKDFFIKSSFNENGESIKDMISGTGNVSIKLPNVITAVVGDTLQLFYRGIILAFAPYNLNLKVTCSKGKQTPRYFEVTPVSGDVGEYPLRFDIRNNAGEVLLTKSTTLKIVDKVSLSSTDKNVLCFGDSLTSGGIWCAEADRRLTGVGGTPSGLSLSNIHFVGKLTNGTTGYFGYGGWSWYDFVTRGRAAFRFQVTGVTNLVYGAVYSNNGHNYTILENNTTEGVGNILCGVDSYSYTPSGNTLTKVSGGGDQTITFTAYEQDSQNPLWDYDNNKMTFIPYANSYCNGNIDIVYTLLSWNAQSSWRKDFTIVINQIKIFADTLHSEFPNAKLKIMGIQVPSQIGGAGANYGAADYYTDEFGLAVTALNMNDAYQQFANDANYSSFVEFVNVSSQFDTDYNMPYTDKDVNTRNSSKKEMIGTNGVHPSTSGYMQIADVVYRNIIKELNI